MFYLIIAVILMFLATFLAILGGGEYLATRLSSERGVYERIVGKELHRLFLTITPQEFVLLHLFLFFGGIGVGVLVLDPITGTLVGGLIGGMGPRFWLKNQWKKRIRAIDEQVEEAMVYMSNSFKANPSLPEAIQDVNNSMGAPISQELGVLLKEYRLGTPLDQALVNCQRRMPSRNLELAISAIIIGRTVGGNIPQVLNDIADTIRESYRLERVIDNQTAQGKMQAWVMGAMPGLVLGAFYFLDPELITPLFETFIGYIILLAAALLNVIGVAIILKVVNIEV